MIGLAAVLTVLALFAHGGDRWTLLAAAGIVALLSIADAAFTVAREIRRNRDGD